MLRLRLVFVFAATVFLTAASEAQPFPQPPMPGPTPLAVVMLPGIDSADVVADLKLNNEQVKVLVERRKELWDEAYATAPKKLAEKAAARNESTDAFIKKTLSEAQYKRLVQLGAQSVLRTPAFGKVDPDAAPTFRLTTATRVVLTRYPELATVFQLTEEQKKQLAAPADNTVPPSARTIRMSKEQADAAKEFLGTPIKAWTVKTAPHLAMQPTQPPELALLEARDVRTDLKLSDADAKTFVALGEKWQKLDTDRATDLSPKDADALGAELKTESEKALAGLTPEQTARLKQIRFQTGGFGGGFPGGGFGGRPARSHIEQLYTDAAVAKELAITEEQVKEFAALRSAFAKDAEDVLGSADSFEPAEKKLNALVAARRAKAEELLTADQKTKFTALVGKPFVGSTVPDNFGPRVPMTEAMRAAWFGKYTFGEFSTLANNRAIRTELKLDEKQLARVNELVTEIRTKFPPRTPGRDDQTDAKIIAERSAYVAEELGKLLSEEQAKRFRQLQLQYWEQEAGTPTSPRGSLVASAAAYPGVAEAIKLTEDQQKKLTAGVAAAEVLTDAQKSAIKEMLGTPFKGPLGAGGGPSPFNVRSSAIVRLFAVPPKDTEDPIKFTDDQVKALTAARGAYQSAIQDARPGGPKGATPAESAAARRAAIEAFDKAVTELLTAEQKPRLAQLVLQSDAAADLRAALTAPETAKKLELTKDQTDKLAALNDDAMKLYQLRVTHLTPAQDQKLGLQMRDAADDRMMTVLTDAQKKMWKDLTGDPAPGIRKTIPGGGGPGGLGGGGFGPGGGFGGFGPGGP
jgi:hypothetical protein